MAQAPRFSRETAQARRAALVDATLAALADHGHAGVSVRRIAAVADVSPGLVNHHFDSLEALVAAAYETRAERLHEALMAGAGPPDAEPRAWLSSFFRASFSPEVIDPRLLNIWVVFWSLVPHAAELKAIQARSWAAYRHEIETRLAALAAAEGLVAFDAPAAALALSSLLDGLWVEACLNPQSYPPEVGIRLCEDWVDAHFLLARARQPQRAAQVHAPA